MKRILIYLFACALLVSCSQRDQGISDNISRVLKSDANQISMSDVTPFEWDELFIFPPYSSEEMVNEALGFAWQEYDKSGIEYNDGHALLVFIRDDKTAAWCMNPRNNGDFAHLFNSNGYSKSKAVFRIEHSENSKRVNIELSDQVEYEPLKDAVPAPAD